MKAKLNIFDIEKILKNERLETTSGGDAVIYARYSSDKQSEMSIEGQLRECYEFAKRKGLRVINVYIDRAKSAKTDRRQSFQEMITDSAKRLFTTVIVWKLDRFARNRSQSGKYKDILRENGVKLISATEHIAEDASGILFEAILEGYAEYYSAELAEKVTRGLTENALRCKSNGIHTVPIGYMTTEDKSIVPNKDVAPVVTEAFQLFADNGVMTEFINFLNSRGVRNRRGKKFDHNAANKMLKNRFYIGEYRYGKIVIPDGIEAIVPKDVFEKVQENIERNRKAPARNKAPVDKLLLSGKIFCGRCGRGLIGDSTVNRHGTAYYYYKCISAKKNTGCKLKAVRTEKIENLVIGFIKSDIFTDSFLDDIADSLVQYQDTVNVSIPMIKKKIYDVEKRINNIIKNMEAGIVSSSISARIQELEEEKVELETKLKTEEVKHQRVERHEILSYLYHFKTVSIDTLAQRKALVKSLINSIYLFDDELVINYNYRKMARKVPLSALVSNNERTGSDHSGNLFNKGSDMTSFGPPQKHRQFWLTVFFTLGVLIVCPIIPQTLHRRTLKTHYFVQEVATMTKIIVPYDERETVENLGAIKLKGCYYSVPPTCNMKDFTRWNRPPLNHTIDGEDRSFGKNYLYVDLIPSSSWYTNTREYVDAVDWER